MQVQNSTEPQEAITLHTVLLLDGSRFLCLDTLCRVLKQRHGLKRIALDEAMEALLNHCYDQGLPTTVPLNDRTGALLSQLKSCGGVRQRCPQTCLLSLEHTAFLLQRVTVQDTCSYILQALQPLPTPADGAAALTEADHAMHGGSSAMQRPAMQHGAGAGAPGIEAGGDAESSSSDGGSSDGCSSDEDDGADADDDDFRPRGSSQAAGAAAKPRRGGRLDSGAATDKGRSAAALSKRHAAQRSGQRSKPAAVSFQGAQIRAVQVRPCCFRFCCA